MTTVLTGWHQTRQALRMPKMQIESRRLLIRPIKLNDHQTWFRAFAERLPRQNVWDAGPREIRDCSQAKFRKWVRHYEMLARQDDYHRVGVFTKIGSELVGQLDFEVFSRGQLQFANFGYQIYNLYWGNGYGVEAAAAGLKFGFDLLNLHRLEAAIHPANKKSIQVAKKIKMRKEGIRRRYALEDEKWHDCLIFAANPEDQ